MKRRAELDEEIIRDRRAAGEIERGIGRSGSLDKKYAKEVAREERWHWMTPAEREARNVAVLELWEMGVSRAAIAERFDLTPQRVSQIVNSFGAGWR